MTEDTLKIASFVPETRQDWNEGLAAVESTYGCNLRCRACHNAWMLDEPELILDQESVLRKLKRKRQFVYRLVVSGGEPTIQRGLPEFLRDVRKIYYVDPVSGQRIPFQIKLDTNGTLPEVIGMLIRDGLIDYVAMDVKGPKDLYEAICGGEVTTGDVEQSMRILANEQTPYEFRTTVVPVRREPKTKFLQPNEIASMGNWVADVTGNNEHPWYLQPFVPGPTLMDETLRDQPRTPQLAMQSALEALQTKMPNARLRYED